MTNIIEEMERKRMVRELERKRREQETIDARVRDEAERLRLRTLQKELLAPNTKFIAEAQVALVDSGIKVVFQEFAREKAKDEGSAYTEIPSVEGLTRQLTEMEFRLQWSNGNSQDIYASYDNYSVTAVYHINETIELKYGSPEDQTQVKSRVLTNSEWHDRDILGTELDEAIRSPLKVRHIGSEYTGSKRGDGYQY